MHVIAAPTHRIQAACCEVIRQRPRQGSTHRPCIPLRAHGRLRCWLGLHGARNALCGGSGGCGGEAGGVQGGVEGVVVGGVGAQGIGGAGGERGERLVRKQTHAATAVLRCTGL
jgi:hypothetical protein